MKKHGEDSQSEYAGLLSALGRIYWQIFSVDLEENTYIEIYARHNEQKTTPKVGLAQEAFRNIMDRFVAPPYQEAMSAFLDHSTLSQRLAECDYVREEFMSVTGSWIDANYIVQKRNADGTVTQVLFTLLNVDEKKKKELEQKHLETMRMQTIAEVISGGFKVSKTDERCTFIMVSDQLAQMLGYESSEELMDASEGCMYGIVNLKDAAREMPAAFRDVAEGKMYTMHYRMRCKDGSWKNVEDRGRLIRKPDGQDELWSFVVDHDEITQKSQALETAKKANAALEKAQNDLRIARDAADAANKAKTTFLFNMSHDIRTPMNAIIGFSTLAEKKLNDPEVLREYLHKIQVSGQGMLSILDNVLELSRIESGKTMLEETPQVTEKVFDECLIMVNPEIEKKHHTVHVSKEIKYPYIYFDSTRVTEIILNILSNAIKYTADGGTIRCVLSQESHPQEGWIYQCVSVTDNGIGMSETFQNHIFDTFVREHSTTSSGIQGTGLGMGIVKKLIDLMHGTIEVKSKLGKGTTISVRVPCRIATFEDTQPKHATKHSGWEPLQGKHILLAEDNDLNAEIAITLLEEEGLAVDRAEDGVKCIEMLENSMDGYYFMILMDIQMPVLDGYKTTENIRKMQNPVKAEIPIVAMTANAFTEDKKKALEAGMNDYVSKPIDMDQLLAVLRKYIK